MFGPTKLPDRHQSATASTAWPIHIQRVFLGFVTFCLVAPLVQTIYPIFGRSIVSPVEEGAGDILDIRIEALRRILAIMPVGPKIRAMEP
jgi:hypothetical protein